MRDITTVFIELYRLFVCLFVCLVCLFVCVRYVCNMMREKEQEEKTLGILPLYYKFFHDPVNLASSVAKPLLVS